MATEHCGQCGAPLPPGYGVLRCAYCGNRQQVAPPPPAAPFGAPPSGPFGTSPPHVPSPSRPNRSLVVAAVLMFALTGIAGAGAVVPMLLFASGEGSGESVPDAVTSPQVGSLACLLADTNGDGVREIGAATWTTSRAEMRPALIDGASGEVLWTDDAVPRSGHEILCLDEQHFALVGQQELQLVIYPAAGPSAALRRPMSDELQKYGVGDACITLRTRDERTIGVSLADGSTTQCAWSADRRLLDDDITVGARSGIIDMIVQPVVAEMEGAHYELRARNPGTPFLEVTGQNGGGPKWTQTLRFVPVGGEAIGALAITAAPGVVVVAGSPRGDDDGPITLVGLSADAGIERYATPMPDGFIPRMRGFFYDGRYVVVSTGSHLVAIEPATGQIAWSL